MSTRAEHYHHAEQLLEKARFDDEARALLLVEAQVHATLAAISDQLSLEVTRGEYPVISGLSTANRRTSRVDPW